MRRENSVGVTPISCNSSASIPPGWIGARGIFDTSCCLSCIKSLVSDMIISHIGPMLMSQTEPPSPDSKLGQVLQSAARLQEAVPDAVLVGGSAAALYAAHRESLDYGHNNDHILSDLEQRFEQVLEAIESTEGWVTNRIVPGKIILGALGDIEAGVRQMIRKRPLEIEQIPLPQGRSVRVPTWDETLRIKAWLIVRRNQVRDYLDVAALADSGGRDHAAATLAGIDDWYADQAKSSDGVASQLVRQLADPRPADSSVTAELEHYKNLDRRWHDWQETVEICRDLVSRMLKSDEVAPQ